MNFQDLQVRADQLGYHFDSLLRLEDGTYVVVLEDSMGQQLEYKGASPQLAVEVASLALARCLEQVPG
jgi:hypothetical protein